jgi:hypothetical protein
VTVDVLVVPTVGAGTTPVNEARGPCGDRRVATAARTPAPRSDGPPAAGRGPQPAPGSGEPKSSGEIWSRNSRNASTSSCSSSGIGIPASASTVSAP